MSLLVCEQEPCSHVLSWLPSMALYADPNWYKDDCVAFPWRAKFSPAETTEVFKVCCFSGTCFVIVGVVTCWGGVAVDLHLTEGEDARLSCQGQSDVASLHACG